MTISAVIPAYNAERYIARAIESVLSQTHPVDEIIVVDDGSTDGTAEVVRSFGEKVQLYQQVNAGVSAARNTGIKAATGDWIAFLDADDEWLPVRIQKQVELLQRNPDLRWLSGNYDECLCDENRKASHLSAAQCAQSLGDKDYFDNYLSAVERYQWGHTSCVLVHRTVFDEVGMFCTDLSLGEDLDLWLRIGYRYPQVGFIPESLSIYHLTVPDSLMTAARSQSLYTRFIDRHFDITQSAGKREDFVPAAGAIMRLWIRGMLFEGRKAEIRELLNRFPGCFSRGYRLLLTALTIFPNLTLSGLRLLSGVVRIFRLRRRVTRRPPATGD